MQRCCSWRPREVCLRHRNFPAIGLAAPCPPPPAPSPAGDVDAAGRRPVSVFQVRQFLIDTRASLKKMLRYVNIKEDVCPRPRPNPIVRPARPG